MLNLSEKVGQSAKTDWYHTVYNDPHVPDNGFFLLIKEAGIMVSSACLQLGSHGPGSGTVHTVCTDNQYRGKGLAKANRIWLLDFAAAHYGWEICLITDAFRIPAIRLSRGLGFDPVMYKSNKPDRWAKIEKAWQHGHHPK